MSNVTPGYMRRFRSMSEFVAHVDGPTDFTGHRGSRTEGKSRTEFTGTTSWDDALGKVFRWEEGAGRVGALRARIGGGVARFKRERVRTAIPPGTASIGAIVTGHPKPIIAVKKSRDTTKGAGKVHRIVVNPVASSGVAASVLETRGGAVLALADAIERRGGRVELVIRAGFAEELYGPAIAGHEILVKRPHERLNLNSVAFALSHPSMLRRLIFSALECAPASVRKSLSVGTGYGIPADVREDGDTLYLPAMLGGDPRWSSEESAAAWVMEYLTEQGLLT